jgi:hypothetical protein
MFISSTIFYQHLDNIFIHFLGSSNILHNVAIICLEIFVSSTIVCQHFAKCCNNFFRNVGNNNSLLQPPAGGAIACEPAARGAGGCGTRRVVGRLRSAGGQRNQGKLGRGTGGRGGQRHWGRTPAGQWRCRGPWRHGGGRESDRGDVGGPAGGSWVERGDRGGADQRRRGPVPSGGGRQ